MAKTLWENRDFEEHFNSLSKEKKLLRRKLRYACFRIQKFIVEGEPEYEPYHEDIKQKVENTEGFSGWRNFAATWDISDPDPISIVRRKWSIQEEWTAVLKQVVPILPGLEHLENNNGQKTETKNLKQKGNGNGESNDIKIKSVKLKK